MTNLDRGQVADFAPLAERAVSVDVASMIRLRSNENAIAAYVQLPFDVLAGRTIAAEVIGPFDVTVSATEFIGWVDGDGAEPARKDAHWLSALPPRTGWERIERIPDSVIRDLVRQGAALAGAASSRSGQQSLLNSVVLTARSADHRIEVPLGPVSALTRMGFLPRASEAAVDIAPGWIRLAATYGSTFLSTGSPLGLFSL